MKQATFAPSDHAAAVSTAMQLGGFVRYEDEHSLTVAAPVDTLAKIRSALEELEVLKEE